MPGLRNRRTPWASVNVWVLFFFFDFFVVRLVKRTHFVKW